MGGARCGDRRAITPGRCDSVVRYYDSRRVLGRPANASRSEEALTLPERLPHHFAAVDGDDLLAVVVLVVQRVLVDAERVQDRRVQVVRRNDILYRGIT